jgi:hypothetical protein
MDDEAQELADGPERPLSIEADDQVGPTAPAAPRRLIACRAR